MTSIPVASRRVLLRGGTVVSPAFPTATAMLTVGDAVAWVGDDAGAERHRGDAEVVELEGRLVAPGFVDAHVHVSKTGFALQSLDLGGATSLPDALDRLAGYADVSDSSVLFAHGWDETGWPEERPFTGSELDRAVGSRIAYVSRVDAHSAVVSAGLVRREPRVATLEGWRGDGVVERDAHHAARAVLDSLWTTADREQATLVALRHAAMMGVTTVHDVNAPHIAPFSDAGLIARLQRKHPLPEVVAYWGAFVGGDHPDAEGLAGYAGDLCVDGAIGSRTAALTTPYVDADTAGHLYLDDTQVRDHVVWCTERGVQAGFHVIGDRGVAATLAGLREAADKVGPDAFVAARHRLEHVEMISPAAISELAALGVVASVQPAFDAAWGWPGGLYERRLGAHRAAPMNPFASMARAGVVLAFGSDSPVTPIDPWAGVRAAVHHHNPDERMPVSAAFEAHTRGGHRACRNDAAGTLVPGSAASYAVWDLDPSAATSVGRQGVLPSLDPEEPLPACMRTVVSGTTVFDVEEPS